MNNELEKSWRRLPSWIIISVMLSAVWMGGAQAQDDACPNTDTLPPRLTIGEEGRVLSDIVLNIRSEPDLNASRVGLMPPNGMFTVLDGPRCADGYLWWQIDYHHAADNVTGWSAEGDPDTTEYWLEPRGMRVMVDGRYHVSDGETTEPEGCLAPPEDYTRIHVGRAELTTRTLSMLDHAHLLYKAAGGAAWDSFRNAITQGSYTGGAISASFGTHDGGGAVDLSVRSSLDRSVLTDDIEPMIYALRVAGFAAWLRDTDSLYPDSPIHIHAIAIGDRELSPAAFAQVNGDGGYLNGFDGLPSDYGGPNPDSHNGPIICRWMLNTEELVHG